MLNKIIDLSLRNALLVLAFAVFLTVLTFPLCCFDQILCWFPRDTS